jgi:predicted ABC-type ATPase
LSSRSIVEAGRRALSARRELLSARKSFSFETTLSGRRELAFVGEARDCGYQLEFRYVGVESVELCHERIAERVAKGGHNVPRDDVSRRFERSMNNLPDAISFADESFVYDNSTTAGITLMAIFTAGELAALVPAIPRWMKRALGPLLNC